jgi:predicted dehydrogenase
MMIGNVCNDEMWFSFGSDGRTGEELARIAKERGVTFEQASRAAFENRVRRAKEIAKDGHAVEVCTRDGGWFLRVGRLN